MSYWFGYRVFDRGIDIAPREAVPVGPFSKYEDAKKEKNRTMAKDIQMTPIIVAQSEEEAKAMIRAENWNNY